MSLVTHTQETPAVTGDIEIGCAVTYAGSLASFHGEAIVVAKRQSCDVWMIVLTRDARFPIVFSASRSSLTFVAAPSQVEHWALPHSVIEKLRYFGARRGWEQNRNHRLFP